jgi:hypothetical protein
MELKINEMDYQEYDNFQMDTDYDNQLEDLSGSGLEIQEPEIQTPTPIIKVVKKGVGFEDNNKPMHQSIPKLNAKRVRLTPLVPEKPKITYDDILSNMGMFVSNGKLQLINNTNKYINNNTNSNTNKNTNSNTNKNTNSNTNKYINNNTNTASVNIPQNSYIYNKYFKDELRTQEENRPLTVNEYKNLLLNTILQQKLAKQRQANYRKMVMPNSNINVADIRLGNFNKLFDFSKR